MLNEQFGIVLNDNNKCSISKIIFKYVHNAYDTVPKFSLLLGNYRLHFKCILSVHLIELSSDERNLTGVHPLTVQILFHSNIILLTRRK